MSKRKGSTSKEKWIGKDLKEVWSCKTCEKAVAKVARSSRGAQGTEVSTGVGNLAHFMHKITLFH